MNHAVIVAMVVVITTFAVFMFHQLQPTSAGEADTSVPFTAIFDPAETLATIDAQALATGREQGAALFDRYQCVGCHADDGRALKKFEALGNKYDLVTLAAYLKRPNPPMPIFPLSDDDRHQLAIYLIDRYPGEELERSDAVPAEPAS